MPADETSTQGSAIRVLGGSVTTPLGFRASGVSCGIKRSGKPDLALIVSDEPAAVAGVFTTNKVRAACVDIDRERVQKGAAQGIVVNSGNANAFTGARGVADALEMCKLAEDALGLTAGSVLGASTGVIGDPLPMPRVRAGVKDAVAGLSDDGGVAAAHAIMTTDLAVKHQSVEVELSGGKVRIGAIAKGSGMIEPNMATMFCFLTTDARLGADPLQALLKASVDSSFNCLTVDGDTSTNDMVLMLANGASGVQVGPDDLGGFGTALAWVCRDMTKAIARDGEGATKLVEVRIAGAASDEDARKAAKTIANSPLVKTAIFGQDPNWGRIVAAAGRSGARIDQDRIDLAVNGEALVISGEPAGLSSDVRKELLSTDTVTIDLDLHIADGRSVVWTCDFSYNYVKINAEYHT